jgi:hypothetical protein
MSPSHSSDLPTWVLNLGFLIECAMMDAIQDRAESWPKADGAAVPDFLFIDCKTTSASESAS